MRAFELLRDDRAASVGGIDGRHEAKVPGLRCPKCGVWAQSGVAYPTVEHSLLECLAIPELHWPLSVEEFEQFAERFTAAVGPKQPLVPGADLGRFSGRSEAIDSDFAWVNPWTPLVRESTWQNLLAAGLELTAIRANLTFEFPSDEGYFELEILPSVRLAGIDTPRCEVCGRLALKRPSALVLDFESFNPAIPLQRVLDLPTILVANELLAQFAEANRLTGAAFSELRVGLV